MTLPTEQSSAESDAGGATYQEELRLPRAWYALIALPALAALVRRRGTSQDGGTRTRVFRAVAQTTILAALLGYFSTLRIVVRDGTLTVGFRRLAEAVPLRRVTACEPTTYHWIVWGGYGIRNRPHARMYNLPSDHGRAVRLTLDDGREISFSSADPDAVCAAIRTGQSATAA